MTVLGHDWYPAEVPANVTLGERSWLYSSFAFVHHRSEGEPSVRIGPDSGIYAFTCFDLGPTGEVEIGRYCAVVGATFSSNGRIVIGDYAFIAHGVVLADSFAALPPAAPPAMRLDSDRGSQDVRIGDDVWIGTRAVILAGAKIGNGAVIGAGAVVEAEVPDYAIVAGNPARIVGWARPRGESGSAEVAPTG
jgi:acetyltransferase-like isoleucine patch superfamily enzyme